MRPSLVVLTLVVVTILIGACGGPAVPLAAEAPAASTPIAPVPSQTLPLPAANTPIPPTSTPLPTNTTKPTSTPRPTQTRAVSGFEVAYSSQNNGEIQLFNLDTKRVTVLAKNHAMWTPRCWQFSADGSRLLYADNVEENGTWVSPLTVLNMETRERIVLPYKDTCASLHPNGMAAVVTTYDDNSNPFFTTIRHRFVDLSTAADITEIASQKYGSFDFSPDGKWMVMNARDRSNQLHFFPITLDQSGQVAAVGEVESLALDIGNRFIGSPKWSPAGDKIAFISLNNFDFDNADIFAISIEYDANGQLALAKISEINMTQGFNKQEGVRYEDLTWSPAGDRIAFWAYTPEKLSADSWTLVRPRVFVLPLDGSGIVEITDAKYPVGETPEWSPDGKKLIFTAGDQYQRTIVMCNPDGSEKKALQIERAAFNAAFRPAKVDVDILKAEPAPALPAATPTLTPTASATAAVTEKDLQATYTPRPSLARMTNLTIDAPSAVRGMQAVYDSARNVIVLFGGTNGQNTILNETWEFNGEAWKKINTPTQPPARFWHGMAFDSDRKVVVMFGGNKDHQGQVHRDTWEFNGQDWRQVKTATLPPDRGDNPGFAYDSCRKKIVLFGGRSFTSPVNSTWEYDGKDWVNANPSGTPLGRTLTAMVFDAQRCKMVLFGGMDLDVSGYADTWEYDGRVWRLVKVQLAPSARWAHAMTYDPVSGKVLLYGGYGPKHPGGKALKDAWVYDGSTWEQVTLSSNFDVEQHTLVFQSRDRYALLYAHSRTVKINPGGYMPGEAPAPAVDVNCALGYTRLAIGKNAQPAGAITLANNIRSEPKISDNILASFVPGMFVKIVDGPVCADGFVFWKVESRFITGGAGWTAEGDGKQYFLEPLE